MQRPAGLKPIGMGRDAAHGVKRDRAACHRLVMLAPEVGPFVLKLNGFVKGDAGQFGRNGADARGGDAAAVCYGFGGIFLTKVLLGHLVKDRAVRNARRSVGGGKVGAHAGLIKGGEFAGLAVDHQRLAVLIAQLQAILRRFRVAVQQHWRVGVAREVVQIYASGLHQAVDQRQNEQPISAGRDADPIIGDGVIPGADRVHPDDPRTAFLQLAQTHLDRVAVMVLGHAKQHEQLGMVPIGLAELPKRAAHRVDASGGHIDRAETAVGRVVRRAESLRPKRCEALRLVAPGEERELFRRFAAQRLQPVGGNLQRLFPADALKLA